MKTKKKTKVIKAWGVFCKWSPHISAYTSKDRAIERKHNLDQECEPKHKIKLLELHIKG